MTTKRRFPSLRFLLTFLSIVSHVTTAKSLVSVASSIDYRYFVAGGTCAAISHGITCPIDVVKTRMQSNPEKYKSLVPATATIIREEGASTLVKGLGPTLVGYGIEGALKFGVYEIAKPMVVYSCKNMSDRLLNSGVCGGMLPFLVASIMAGAVASLVLVPMESTRIRMVTDPDFEGLGLLGGLSRLVQESGLLPTLTVGMGAMLAKQIPYTFGKQVSFDVVAKFLYRIVNSPTSTFSESMSPEFIKWTVSVLSAMVASVMACLLSQPGDVILTETYKGGEDDDKQCSIKGQRECQSITEISSTIYNRQGEKGFLYGVSGFFTGLQARFVHVGMIITSQLVIYDIVKQLLGLPATGSH